MSLPTSLPSFHPAVAAWFRETLGAPTSAQGRGWAAIRSGRDTLIAAPTGSGKTLAAFLTALDDLVQESAVKALPDEVRVVYVSPLKALSADIHKNLVEPRRGIRKAAAGLGLAPPRLTAAVRTGDTPHSERAAMLRTPPHILVTTPESLYLLLTAERSRAMLRTVRTVIVDEIHAVIGTRRGAHLALSLERLQEAAERPVLRIGLSATQKPIAEVARYLTGGRGECAIVDERHRRTLDLALEIPASPLDAVMSHEVWAEYYDRLAVLVGGHRTSLIFVNTRRMAERIARHLSERLGEDAVTAHHGSLAKEKRLDAEARLKAGTLKALVATASLELGIDIGHVDLVCQIGSPHRIATLLQRVGRSGHTIHGIPKGRLFPVSRDDLVECAALLRAVGRGELDAIVSQDAPLDVLAQQVVAEASARDLPEDDLFSLVRRAWPYRGLQRRAFDEVIRMLAEGFATRRGRRAALLHRDEVNGRVRGRRGARLLAMTSGGAIPEVADYRVVLDPEEVLVGTLNEDFAIESSAGDVFQLGNASWRVLQVGAGVVRVADARGAPPTLPFWLGEAPGRSDELSRAVSDLRVEIDRLLGDDAAGGTAASVEWLMTEAGVERPAADQIASYLSDSRQALGMLPTQESLVLERFFDESGGMQLVLHAPFGSRVNRAWGLALRKRFCRQFNFELQAAATEDALLLSLGPQHSFPLSDVFRYLHPATAREVLVQAFLDAPVFQTRWRWNTTISLAVPRNRNGRKVPPQLQRMLADDLMAAVFPDAAACLENIPGDRQIPEHPLVDQTVRDCLQEAMDYDALAGILAQIHEERIRCVARDLPEPSPLSAEILNARPYAFLDDAPLEERRAHAVQTRRATAGPAPDGIGALDASAIERVRDQQRVDPRSPDELHDALLTTGLLFDGDIAMEARGAAAELMGALNGMRRAGVVRLPSTGAGPARAAWIAAERIPELLAVHPDAVCEPGLSAPASRAARTWARDEALVELLRGRLAILGPTTAAALAHDLALSPAECEAALLTLESAGAVLRGRFEQGAGERQWCDRTLLARIHRYTVNRLRAEIEPVTPADFMRFLFEWQHGRPSARLSGIDGLRAIMASLDGFEAAAAAWENTILPARMDRYDPALLDILCLTGEVGWARLSPAVSDVASGFSRSPTPATVATPVALFLREHADAWMAEEDRAAPGAGGDPHNRQALDSAAQSVLGVLVQRGACFVRDIAAASGLPPAEVGAALARLAAAGLVTSDSFGGLRSLVRAARHDAQAAAASASGRWSVLTVPAADDAAAEVQARALLRRYGVVFRRLLAREAHALPWRALARVYRRLEARGEIRGGRFVTGAAGEQFALPAAVDELREARRTPRDGTLVVVSAADPLNLAGIVDAGQRVRAVAGSRVVYRDGVPLAALEGDYLRPLADIEPSLAASVASALAGRRVPAVSAGYIGRSRSADLQR